MYAMASSIFYEDVVFNIVPLHYMIICIGIGLSIYYLIIVFIYALQGKVCDKICLKNIHLIEFVVYCLIKHFLSYRNMRGVIKHGMSGVTHTSTRLNVAAPTGAWFRSHAYVGLRRQVPRRYIRIVVDIIGLYPV